MEESLGLCHVKQEAVDPEEDTAAQGGYSSDTEIESSTEDKGSCVITMLSCFLAHAPVVEKSSFEN